MYMSDQDRKRKEAFDQAAGEILGDSYKPFTPRQIVQQTPQPVQQQTPIQRLLNDPIPQNDQKWYKGDTPTATEVGARIYTISQADPEKGHALYTQFQQFQNTPGSPYYNPYASATNKAIKALSDLGFDMRGGITKEWLEQNAWLKNYYRMETGNTPLAPSSKSTKEQDAAYWYYQALKAEETTEKAENELAALNKELQYWAGRTDRNMNDDEILAKVDWTKYPTLASMDEARTKGLPTVLNRAIGYNKDYINGMLWAARGNESTGSAYQDSIKALLGQGNSWQENKDVRDKLNPDSPNYSPYSAGSTIDEAALYFDVAAFGPNWVTENGNRILMGNDATAKKQLDTVIKAEKNTKQAENELKELNAEIDDWLKTTADADTILEDILDSYPMLKKMNDGMQPGGKLVDTTRAIDFNMKKIEADVRRRVEEKKNAPSGNQYSSQMGDAVGASVPTNEANDAVLGAKNDAIQAHADTIRNAGTDEEKIVFQTAGTYDFDAYAGELSGMIEAGTIPPESAYNSLMESANQYAKENYFDARRKMLPYQQTEKELNEARELKASGNYVSPFAQAEREEAYRQSNEYDNFENVEDAIEFYRNLGSPDSLLFVDGNLREQINNAYYERSMSGENVDIETVAKEIGAKYAEELEREYGPNAEAYKLDEAISGLEERLAAQKADYDAGAKIIKKAQNGYAVANGLAEVNGLDAPENGMLELMDMIFPVAETYIPKDYQFQNSVFGAYQSSVYRADKEELSRIAPQVQGTKAELQAKLDDIKALREKASVAGIILDDDQEKNLDRAEEYCKEQIEQADWLLAPLQDDYEEVVKKTYIGVSLDQRNPLPSTPYDQEDYTFVGGTPLISVDESYRDQYLYILGKYGPETAHSVRGILRELSNLHNREKIREAGEELTRSGILGAAAANLLAVAFAPLELIPTAATLGSMVFGYELSPNDPIFTATNFRNSVTNTTKDEINKATEGNKAANFLANLAYDVGRSFVENKVNMATFGITNLGLNPSGKVATFLADALESGVNALPMSLEVLGSSYQSALDNGYSVGQAYAMAGAATFAELISESIEVETFKNAFLGEGTDEFVKQLGLGMLNEGIGEFSSEVVGAWLEHAAQENIYGKDPEEWDWDAVLDDAVYAGLLGAVSGGLDVATGTVMREAMSMIDQHREARQQEILEAKSNRQSDHYERLQQKRAAAKAAAGFERGNVPEHATFESKTGPALGFNAQTANDYRAKLAEAEELERQAKELKEKGIAKAGERAQQKLLDRDTEIQEQKARGEAAKAQAEAEELERQARELQQMRDEVLAGGRSESAAKRNQNRLLTQDAVKQSQQQVEQEALDTQREAERKKAIPKAGEKAQQSLLTRDAEITANKESVEARTEAERQAVVEQHAQDKKASANEQYLDDIAQKIALNEANFDQQELDAKVEEWLKAAEEKRAYAAEQERKAQHAAEKRANAEKAAADAQAKGETLEAQANAQAETDADVQQMLENAKAKKEAAAALERRAHELEKKNQQAKAQQKQEDTDAKLEDEAQAQAEMDERIQKLLDDAAQKKAEAIAAERAAKEKQRQARKKAKKQNLDAQKNSGQQDTLQQEAEAQAERDAEIQKALEIAAEKRAAAEEAERRAQVAKKEHEAKKQALQDEQAKREQEQKEALEAEAQNQADNDAQAKQMLDNAARLKAEAEALEKKATHAAEKQAKAQEEAGKKEAVDTELHRQALDQIELDSRVGDMLARAAEIREQIRQDRKQNKIALLQTTNQDGQKVNVQFVDFGEGDAPVAHLANGDTVALDDLNLTKEQQILLNAAADMNEQAGQDLILNYDESNQFVTNYVRGFKQVYSSAAAGQNIDHMHTPEADSLTDAQRMAAWSAGREEWVQKNRRLENIDLINKQVAALSASAGASDSSQTATIAAALAAGRKEAKIQRMASAAAQHASATYGGQETADALKGILMNAAQNGVTNDQVRVAFITAALGGGQASTVLQSIVENGEPDAQALVDAAAADRQDEQVLGTINQAVEQNMAAGKVRDLVGDKALDNEDKAKQKLADEKARLRENRANLKKQQDLLASMVTQQEDLVAQLMENPGDTSIKDDISNGLKEIKGQRNAVAAAGNDVRTAEESVTKAQEELDKKRSDALNAARAQAQQAVSDQMMAEQQEEAALAEQAKAEEQARAEQAAAEQETGNIATFNADEFADRVLGGQATKAERTKIRNMAKQIMKEFTLDAVQRRDTFVRQVGQKYGVNIRFGDGGEGLLAGRGNGYYDPDTNTIVLDADATIGDAMYAVLGHELTHVAEQSKTYDELATALLRLKYGNDVGDYRSFIEGIENGTNRSRAAMDVLGTQSLYSQRLGRNIGVEYAAQEIIADIMGKDVLKGNKEFIDRLAAEHRNVAQRILDSIKSFLRKLGGAEGQWKNDAQKIVDMLETALKEHAQKADAGTVNESLKEYGIEVDEKSGAAVQYSIRTVPQTDAEKEAVVARLVNSGLGFTEEESRAWVDSLSRVSTFILQNMAALDYESDPRYSWIKTNSDYSQGSIDFNNNCPKRVQFTAIFDRLQKEFPDRVFTAQDYEAIRQKLIQQGVTVTCGPCFVEDRRQHTGEIAQGFIDQLKDGTLKPKFRNMIGKDSYVPTQYDLVTYDGLKKLYDNHRGIHDAFVAFNNARGMASARLLEGMAEYNNQIKKWSKRTITGKNNKGGLRIFSLSDADVRTMIDIIQIVLDSSEKALMIQGYTKKPWFARMVKDTGMRILRSHIPKGDGIRDGQIWYDDVEGINRFDRYYRDENGIDVAESSQNIGDNIIGINDDMIRLAMITREIDQIIPFHSSLANMIRNQKKIGNWNNYKKDQTEKDAATGKVADKQVNIYKDVINAWAAKGRPITNKVEFVNAFLEVCKSRNLIPRFAKFLNMVNGEYVYTDGYEKFLVDYKLFDRDTGEIIPQVPVRAVFDDAFNRQVMENYVNGVSEIVPAKEEDYQAVRELFAGQKADSKAEHPGRRYSLPSDETLENLIRHYIANGGMLAETDVFPGFNNPKTEPPAAGQRQFGSRTSQRSDALRDEVKEHLAANSLYNPDTNGRQINRALEWVKAHATANDPGGYYAAAREALAPDFNFASADGQGRMLVLMSMAAKSGDVAMETMLADAYNKQGTGIGQALQARNVFRLMSPGGRESIIRKTEDDINKQYADKGKKTRVHLSEETIQAARDAQTEKDFNEVRKRANKELAEQMPSDWKDKLRGFRYFCMLFNPVTHIRNVLGNAGFMPAIAAKNKIGAIAEKITGAKQGERTKTLGLASQDARAFAKQDALDMKDELTGEAKYNDMNPVERERKPFSGWLQKMLDFNSNALEWEDWVFLQRHYRNALAGWMTANKMTGAQLQANPDLLAKARAYAVQEAQKATYRDASKFASMMSDIVRKGGPAGFFVDAALPFKKTPTNILKRGIEYSPIGLAKTLFVDSAKLIKYTKWANSGEDTKAPAGALSPTQYIDNLAAGLSGSAIAALGALLAGMGWLKVDLDDDDEIAKQNGEQAYALSIELFGQDISYTVDWLAPSSMPLFVGASIFNEAMRPHEAEDALDIAGHVVDGFLNISEPVFNLSMLDGVNSLLTTNNGSDTGNNLTDIFTTIVSNYVTSFAPALLGKFAKTFDTTRRETFIESGTSDSEARIQRTWQKILAKVPGATYLLKPYVSPLGETEQMDLVTAIIQNFLSPGYFKTVDISEMEQEMQRLYEATGEKAVIPKQPAKYYQAGGEKFIPDAEQYTQLQLTRGGIAKDLLEKVVASPEYQVYGDDARVKMVKDAWEFATQTAKQQLTPDAKMDTWVAEAQADPLKAINERREQEALTEAIAAHKTDLFKAIKDDDIASALACIEGLKKDGKDKSYIKSAVTKEYKPQYLDAVRNGDDEAAASIMATLMSLKELGYERKTFKEWLEADMKKQKEEGDLDE